MNGLPQLATSDPEPGRLGKINGKVIEDNPVASDVPADAPEHCPGTESDNAGKASACDGCPNQTICASTPKGPDPDLPLIKERLKNVKHKILILSGKGGVGKSTFTGQLGWAFAATKSAAAVEREGRAGSGSLQDVDVDDEDLAQVGVMDIDICGPSMPKVFGLEGETIHQSASGWTPVYVQDNLSVMSIGFMLPSDDDAVIWRGPKKNGLIKQFLRDVDWGALDYLLVDTPPGTSDEHLSIANFLKESGIDGAVVITTPQEVAIQDVRREIDFCRKVNIPILGIVENMSGFVCPSCAHHSDIFIPSTGGAKLLAKETSCDLLGKVPLDPRIGQCCDHGLSFMDEFPESPATLAFLEIIAKIKAKIHAVPGNDRV